MSLTLYYFHDPMCCWCWAFRPRWQEIVAGLPDHVRSQRILGGLAPDSDQTMPAEMQAKLKSIWQKIQQTVPGTPFNFEFWEKCTDCAANCLSFSYIIHFAKAAELKRIRL